MSGITEKANEGVFREMTREKEIQYAEAIRTIKKLWEKGLSIEFIRSVYEDSYTPKEIQRLLKFAKVD